ncbi:hypothetical protein [Amycolatopsis sp. NPDC051102]|uniref:hypothetical protein n=1 Tax=Amycolatopsis sp. NPDC051102 TaxID=3155163 RepID=UPI00341C0F2E
MVAELGMPVDLDLVRYRRFRRWIVREEVRSARWVAFGGLTGVAAFFTGAYLVARHFTATDTAFWAGVGVFVTCLLTWPPIAVLRWGMRRFPRVGTLASMLFFVAMETAAALIVYGEVVGKGPIHAVAGNFVEHSLIYDVAQAILIFSFLLTGYLVLAPIVVWTGKRRRVRHHPDARAVDTVFRCIELAHDRGKFRQPGTRYQLVTHTHEVAHLLQHGLWRTMPVRSPLAAAELRRRCLHAGQSIEILCAALVLPEAATRERYLLKMVRLAETLLSGNLGDLPDDPDRAAYTIRNRIASARRLATKVVVAAGPLAVFLLLQKQSVFTTPANVPYLTASLAWLVTFGLTAVNRFYPGEISRLPLALDLAKGGQ